MSRVIFYIHFLGIRSAKRPRTTNFPDANSGRIFQISEKVFLSSVL